MSTFTLLPRIFAFGSNDDDTLVGGVGDDILLGRRGDDILDGGAGRDILIGGRGDDALFGGAGSDVILGGSGVDTVYFNDLAQAVAVDLSRLRAESGEDRDVIIGVENVIGSDFNDVIEGDRRDNALNGGSGSDTLTGGDGHDAFVFNGDPFDGADVSAEGRQIIGNEDFITDFNFHDDKYQLDQDDFDVVGDLSFAALDANADDALIPTGANVIVLLNADNDGDDTTPFLAGTAANQIAELVEDDGAGFFVYFNTNLGVNRLAYSTNLNDASADLKIVSRHTDLEGQDAIDALADFSAANFEFI